MANSPIGQKDRPWRARITHVNGESSASISAGMPVALDLPNITLNYVVLPGTAGIAAHNGFAGVAVNTAAAGQPVETIVGGYVASARFVIRTRAATTDTWASVVSIAAGAVLSIDTDNNAFITQATVASGVAGPYAILAQTAASVVSAASASTVHSGTASTANRKVWIRNLG